MQGTVPKSLGAGQRQGSGSHDRRFFRLTQIPGERRPLTAKRIFMNALLVGATGLALWGALKGGEAGVDYASRQYQALAPKVSEHMAETRQHNSEWFSEMRERFAGANEPPLGVPQYAQDAGLSEAQYIVFFGMGERSYANRIANAAGENVDGLFVRKCFGFYADLCRKNDNANAPSRERLAAAQLLTLINRVSLLDRSYFSWDPVHQLFVDMVDTRRGARRYIEGENESLKSIAEFFFNGRDWGVVTRRGDRRYYKDMIDRAAAQLEMRLVRPGNAEEARRNSLGKHSLVESLFMDVPNSGKNMVAVDAQTGIVWWVFTAPRGGRIQTISDRYDEVGKIGIRSQYALEGGDRLTVENTETLQNVAITRHDRLSMVYSIVRKSGEVKEFAYVREFLGTEHSSR